MSFSYTVVLKDTGGSHSGEVTSSTGVDGNPEVVRAIDALGDAVLELFRKNLVFGENWYKHNWQVNINGHFNEDHEPAEGWSNDFLTFGVVQLNDEDEKVE